MSGVTIDLPVRANTASTPTYLSTGTTSSGNWHSMVNEMALNAVIQKHSNLGGIGVASSAAVSTNKTIPQPLIIPQTHEGVASISMHTGVPSYITLSSQSSMSTMPLLAQAPAGTQIIPASSTIALSQLQGAELPQQGKILSFKSSCNYCE